MPDNKKSFVLYSDLIHTVSKLPNEKAGELFKHILEYVNDTNPTTEDLLIQIAFEPIKQSLKRDLKKWSDGSDDRVEKARKAGLASAEARRLKQLESTKSNSVVENPTKSTVSVSDSDSVTVNDNVLIKKVEKEKLIQKHGQKGFDWIVDKLSNYKLSSGKKYKSDYGAINSWVAKEWQKEKGKSNSGTSNLVF